MTKGSTLTINYIYEKETPGTIRYQEVGPDNKPLSIEDGAKAPTFYVRKSALGTDVPKKITVTITAA